MTSVVEIADRRPEPWCRPATVRVALAGCGAVGSALVRELANRRDALESRHGMRVELTRVLVRDVARDRDAALDRSLFTADLDDFLRADADVVIEAIGGIDPARCILESALRRGREVITANKELLAEHGTSLTALAQQHGAALRYDAAVGGGVPILRLLDDALGAGIPARVRGIFNGTTNFVLTRLERGASLDAALAEARRAGFAEADASRDLDGRDAAAKIRLVAWAAFGVAPETLDVRRASLLPDPARFARLADRFGRRVRQVGECALVDGVVVGTVEPLLVSGDGPLARTRDEQNHVEVHTGWSAPLCASGPGAGGLPTATAILSDLLSTGGGPRRTSRARPGSADARRSDWALEVRGAPATLHRAVADCGLVRTDDRAASAWTLVTAVTPLEIASICDVLTAAGADPIAARMDDADATACQS